MRRRRRRRRRKRRRRWRNSMGKRNSKFVLGTTKHYLFLHMKHGL